MIFTCPKIDCTNDEILQEGEKCPLCGTHAEGFGKVALGNLYVAKSEYREEQKLVEHKNSLDPKILVSPQMTDTDIEGKILEDMNNLAMHEAGTAWMRLGTLLLGNSTDAIIGACLKGLIDQNKIIIRQNELLIRNLKRIADKGSIS